MAFKTWMELKESKYFIAGLVIISLISLTIILMQVGLLKLRTVTTIYAGVVTLIGALTVIQAGTREEWRLATLVWMVIAFLWLIDGVLGV